MLEQDSETGLLKVVIGSQRVLYIVLFHEQERNAVHERPLLIGVFLIQFHALTKQAFGSEMYCRIGMPLDATEELGEHLPVFGGTEIAGQFDKDILRGSYMS